MDGLLILWNETAIANFKFEQLIMILVGCGLLFLAIRKGFEPLLLFIMSGLKRESSHF